MRVAPCIAISALLLACLAAAPAHADDPPELLAADESYELGDCFRAINEYRAALSAFTLAREQRLRALRHTSFCHFEIGDLSLAARGLTRYLSAAPEDAEARIKLVRSLYQLNRFEEAREQAALVKDPAYLEEAWLTSARSSIELDDPAAAVSLIESVEPSPEVRFVLLYWKGVAQYRRRNLSAARSAFVEARDSAPQGHWVQEAVKPWLEDIQKTLKRVSGSISMGYLFDSNVSQRSIVTTGPGRVPISPVPNGASYTRDRAFWASINLNFLLHHDRLFQFATELDASSPFYQNNPAYNNQNLSATAFGNFSFSRNLSTGCSLKFWDSRYKYDYYQNYLVADPYVNWSPSEKWLLRGDIGYTFYLHTNHGRILSPTGSVRFFANRWLSPIATFNYTRARGSTAIYLPGAGPTAASGVAFSRYSSRTVTLGASLALPEEFSFTGQASRSWTYYEYEYLPGPLAGSIPNRSDRTWAFTSELSRPIGRGFWLAAAGTYTSNRSHGLQGGITGNLQTNYNYDRLYLLFTLNLKF